VFCKHVKRGMNENAHSLLKLLGTGLGAGVGVRAPGSGRWHQAKRSGGVACAGVGVRAPRSIHRRQAGNSARVARAYVGWGGAVEQLAPASGSGRQGRAGVPRSGCRCRAGNNAGEEQRGGDHRRVRYW
jgi:hypothetical protein